MILADGKPYKYPGHFYVANRQVNVQTGTIKIQGIFPNPDYILRPGLYAKIRVAADTKRGALLVPQSASPRDPGTVPGRGRGCRQPGEPAHGQDRQAGGRTQRSSKTGWRPANESSLEGLQKVSDGMEVKPRLVPAEPESAAASTPVGESATPAASASPANQS